MIFHVKRMETGRKTLSRMQQAQVVNGFNVMPHTISQLDRNSECGVAASHQGLPRQHSSGPGHGIAAPGVGEVPPKCCQHGRSFAEKQAIHQASAVYDISTSVRFSVT